MEQHKVIMTIYGIKTVVPYTTKPEFGEVILFTGGEFECMTYLYGSSHRTTNSRGPILNLLK